MIHTEKLYATECMRVQVSTALDVLWEGRFIPAHNFETCHGVLILSTRDFGAVVSRAVGSGLLLSHDPQTGQWSSPLSVELHGMGLGLSAGAEEKNMVVFFRTPNLISKFAQTCKLQLEGHVAKAHWGERKSEEHHAETTAFCFSRGVHCGIGLEGATVKWNNARHQDFYGAAITPRHILLGGHCKVRCNARSGAKELQDQLIIMAAGGGAETLEEEEQQVHMSPLQRWRAKVGAVQVPAI
jgi:lipid-binding SYLF domain-containing protein